MKTAVMISILLFLATPIRADDNPSGLERLDFMIGKWRGTNAGEPGEGQVERECARALNGRFLETYKQVDPDSSEETFELAAPGKEFARYTASTLRRAEKR